MSLGIPLALRELLMEVRALLHRRTRDRELDSEMRFHVEMQTAKNLALGMSPEEAERSALVAFGSRERYKEEVRDARGGRWIEQLGRDVRLAVRGLRRAPSFTGTAIASLALATAAAVSLFTLVDTVLLRPLPYTDSGRLVGIGHTAAVLGVTDPGQSEATFVLQRRHARSFEESAVYWENEISITDGEEAERIRIALVTPSLFRVLDAKPHIGRVPTDADLLSDGMSEVVISHELWVRRYGADSSIIGRTIETNRTPDVVIGVMPADFDFPSVGTQLWMPTSIDSANPLVRDLFMTGVARLRPGVSPAAAERELASLLPRLPELSTDATAEVLGEGGLRPHVTALHDIIVGDVRPALVILFLAAALVVIVAWANVASLCAVRAERRRREVAVARALGAGTVQLARAFFVESLLVALAGGTLGLWLAWLAVGTRFGFEIGQLPRLHELRLGGASIVLATVLALVSAFGLTVVSLLRVGRLGDLAPALRSAGRRTTASREGQRVQRTLVAMQLALALTLLVAASMMLRSVWRLQHVDPGFDPRNVLVFELNPPARGYLQYPRAARLHLELTERLRAIPGVLGAEMVSRAPLAQVESYLHDRLVVDDGAATADAQPRRAMVNFATPGYFALMEIPVLEGRTFQPGDLAGSARMILSEGLGRTLFRGGQAVGQRVRFEGRPRLPSYTVVGVVGDVPGEALAKGRVPAFYLPTVDDLRATPDSIPALPYVPREGAIVVRTTGAPFAVLPEARRILRELDAKIPLAKARTMEQALERSTARMRLTTILLAVAAGTTVLLGAIGIFGVVSYTVSLRAPEFGIRLALGATPAQLRAIVLRQGGIVVGAGILIGLAGALALARALRTMLYEIAPHDPISLVVVPLALVAIAMLASWLPARRAAATDPASALRSE